MVHAAPQKQWNARVFAARCGQTTPAFTDTLATVFAAFIAYTTLLAACEVVVQAFVRHSRHQGR